jgi:hypothetical protein
MNWIFAQKRRSLILYYAESVYTNHMKYSLNLSAQSQLYAAIPIGLKADYKAIIRSDQNQSLV